MSTTIATIVTPLLSGLVDSTGAPLSGGKVYPFAAGTTTPKTTWTDRAKTTPATHPIILDAAGTAQIYADGIYKLRVDTADDVTVSTWDNLPFRSMEGAMATWTPTYGAQAGTWAATTRVARYHRVGDLCFCSIYATGTPSTTPTYLTFTLPIDAVGTGWERYLEGFSLVGAANDVCHVLVPSSGSTAQLYRRDKSAWAASATTIVINFWYEI